MQFYHTVMGATDVEGIASSVDSDQTAPSRAVTSGSAPFSQTWVCIVCTDLSVATFKNFMVKFNVESTQNTGVRLGPDSRD